MKCLFHHNWGWPRKRGNKNIQVCLECGSERESRVCFDGPRYRRTQDAIPNFSAPTFEERLRQNPADLPSAA